MIDHNTRGMIDHNTRRVLLSFLIFYSCSRKVTSDSSEGATVTIVLAILLLLLRVLFMSIVSARVSDLETFF
jgi:hypothetical protein